MRRRARIFETITEHSKLLSQSINQSNRIAMSVVFSLSEVAHRAYPSFLGLPKFSATLLQLLIVAKEVSWDFNVEHLETWIKSTSNIGGYPEPALKLRLLLAEFQSVWSRILPRLPVSQGFTDASLCNLLGDENYKLFKTAEDLFGKRIQRLARAVNIEAEYLPKGKDSVNDFMMNSTDNHSVISTDVHGMVLNDRSAKLFLAVIKQCISAESDVNSLGGNSLARAFKTRVSWDLDEESTADYIEFAMGAIQMMQGAMRDVKLVAENIPDFRQWAAVVYWRLKLGQKGTWPGPVKPFARSNDSSGDLFSKTKSELKGWPSIPERPFGIHKRQPVDPEQLRPHGTYRGNALLALVIPSLTLAFEVFVRLGCDIMRRRGGLMAQDGLSIDRL